VLDLHAARVRWVIAFALIAILAITRVAMTHRVFSPTYDEPLHTISGYEYLVEHRYTTDIEHPPIARAVLALPFAWNAAPGAAAPSPAQTWVDRGNALFDDHGHYMRGVTKARAGNLLFLLLGIAGAAGWAYGRLGAGGALLAAALFSALPPVLAHAGLATTDMSGTAALALALWALDRWLVTRSWKATATLAFAIALGLLTKFSFPMFFGAAAVIVCVAGRKLPLRKALAACAITALAVWAAYFFSFGTMAAAHVCRRRSSSSVCCRSGTTTTSDATPSSSASTRSTAGGTTSPSFSASKRPFRSCCSPRRECGPSCGRGRIARWPSSPRRSSRSA
jgi:hypothetical protein